MGVVTFGWVTGVVVTTILSDNYINKGDNLFVEKWYTSSKCFLSYVIMVQIVAAQSERTGKICLI